VLGSPKVVFLAYRVVASLLLLLLLVPACQPDSSSLPGARRWSLLIVALDAVSSSRGATSWVHAKLFYFSFSFFPLCLAFISATF
jgi:hypothetical protein